MYANNFPGVIAGWMTAIEKRSARPCVNLVIRSLSLSLSPSSQNKKGGRGWGGRELAKGILLPEVENSDGDKANPS